MTQELFTATCNIQEVLMSMAEKDQEIREVMRSSCKTEDLGPHMRMLRFHVEKLGPLLTEFETAAMLEQENETHPEKS